MASRNDLNEKDGIYEINITPFVDIVLVLLIIFMLSTPALVYRGFQVSLPKSVTAQEMSHVTLALTLTKDSRVLIDQKEVSRDRMSQILDELKKSQTLTDAVIAADAEVPHGRVIEIADLLREQGVTQIGFLTGSARRQNKPSAEKVE